METKEKCYRKNSNQGLERPLISEEQEISIANTRMISLLLSLKCLEPP